MAEESEPVFLTSEKSDVYVVPNPAAGNAFLVVPGTFGVPEDGEKIWIRNVSGNMWRSRFALRLATVRPGQSRIEVEALRPRKAPVGVYDYKVNVIVQGTPVPAQGGSDPRIVYG